MKVKLNIGKTHQYLEVSDKAAVSILQKKELTFSKKGVDAVEDSLDYPLGTLKLEEIVKPGEKIVIVTSDVTRPMPSDKVLPSILERLYKAGCKKEDISIVFALGSHRRQSKEEMIQLVGKEVYESVKCLDGDMEDVVHMGRTSAGTPVDIVRVVAEADRRICLGNIEYHYFAGYSGGAKAIMPGVSTRKAIQSNHSKMVHRRAVAGNLDDNPVRIDLEEAIHYCPIDFICNVILDENKEIIYSVAGDYIKAHRHGADILDTIYCAEIDQKADIVVVSQGGSPKDSNLYQTQKALDNAKHAIKKDGIIILLGSCEEGMGDEVFEDWMLKAKSPQDLINRIEKKFKLGGHKAAAIALVLEDAEIYLVSEMEKDFVESIFMTPFASVQAAYDRARKKFEKEATVIVMPYGGSVLPRLK